MATATEAKYGTTVISVDSALSIRSVVRSSGQPVPEFRCVECDGPVRPHKGGGHASAHFEHLQRNLGCNLCHKARHKRSDAAAIQSKYADQFNNESHVEHPVQQRETPVTVFVRKPEVRIAALARSKGSCEYCNAPGFPTTDGRTYLETHHIDPLSEGGADSIHNVIALCPNHHREAHFGGARARMKTEMKHIIHTKNSSACPEFMDTQT